MSRTDLRNLIVQNFNSDEIRQLCFDLNIDDESLPDETKPQLAMGLVEFCEDHGLLQDLIALCSSRRPHLEWPAPYDPTLLVGEFSEDDESPTTRDRFLQVRKYQLAILLAVPVLLIAAIVIVLTVPGPDPDGNGGDVTATSDAADDLDTRAPATAESNVSAAFSAWPLTGDAPLTVQFENQSENASSYRWNFGDSRSPTNSNPNPSHTYDEPGVYSVVLVAMNNSDEDTARKPGFITVEVPRPEAIVDADLTTGQAPFTVQFYDRSEGSPDQRHWDFGDGRTSDERNPLHTYSVEGNYDVKLMVTNERGPDFTTLRVKVTEPLCTETVAISDEAPSEVKCPAGYMMTGVECSGAYCDNKSLTCCQVSNNAAVFDAQESESSFISEESGRNEYKSDSGFVYGIRCRNIYCDDIQFLVSDSLLLRNTGTCNRLPWVSEENGRITCDLPGYFVAGALCSKKYCDSISLWCCQAQ